MSVRGRDEPVTASRAAFALIATLMLVALAGCSGVASGQVAGPTPTATPSPRQPGIHTPADVLDQFDRWGADYKLRLSDDVVVLYTHMPNSAALWAAPAMINHIPSVSTALILPMSGGLSRVHEGDESGRAALEAVLSDEATMMKVFAGIPEEVRSNRGVTDWEDALRAANEGRLEPIQTRYRTTSRRPSGGQP